MRALLFALLVAGCGSSTSDAPDDAGPDAASDAGPPDPGTYALASGQDFPHGVAVDDTWVYWTNVVLGTVRKSKKHGMEPPVLVAENQNEPTRLATNDGYLYWTNAGTPSMSFFDGELVRISLDPSGGGPPQVIASNQRRIADIAFDHDHVYWVVSGTLVSGHYDGDGSIWRASKDGSAPEMLAQTQNYPSRLAVDATHVYWTNDYGGTVMRCAVTGCSLAPDILYDMQDEPSGIALDGAGVYWANYHGGSVMKGALDGKSPAIELAGSRGFIDALTTDGHTLYWTEAIIHDVMSIPNAGGALTPRAGDQKLPLDIAVDDQAVYWTDETSGTVMRAPK
ncbi:MAG: hypothetical protein ABIP39_13760 [Polyangiaceae bacterium]